jgi:hypothetical protein
MTTDLSTLRGLHSRNLVLLAFRSYLDRGPTEQEAEQYARLVPVDDQDLSHLLSAIKETDDFSRRNLAHVAIGPGVKSTLTARQATILRILRDSILSAPR